MAGLLSCANQRDGSRFEEDLKTPRPAMHHRSGAIEVNGCLHV
jgi:hypothetical protein